MNKLLLLILTFATLTAFSQKADPIAEIFKDYQGENPGGAVAIFQDVGIVFHQSFGMAEMETKKSGILYRQQHLLPKYLLPHSFKAIQHHNPDQQK